MPSTEDSNKLSSEHSSKLTSEIESFRPMPSTEDSNKLSSEDSSKLTSEIGVLGLCHLQKIAISCLLKIAAN